MGNPPPPAPRLSKGLPSAQGQRRMLVNVRSCTQLCTFHRHYLRRGDRKEAKTIRQSANHTRLVVGVTRSAKWAGPPNGSLNWAVWTRKPSGEVLRLSCSHPIGPEASCEKWQLHRFRDGYSSGQRCTSQSLCALDICQKYRPEGDIRGICHGKGHRYPWH